MKKNLKHEDILTSLQEQPDIAAILAKIQQQLMALEKKIDGLMGQSSERPFKRFDHFRRNEGRDRGNSYGEKRFTQAICADCHQECEVPFKPTGDRPVYCKECFSKRKGSPHRGEYNNHRAFAPEGDFSQRRHPDKKHGRKNQEYGEKKPVSRRRKERA